MNQQVATLIHKRLRSVTETIHCEERFCIARVANYFVVNVYLPCIGTPDRFLICQDLFQDIVARYTTVIVRVNLLLQCTL